VNFFSSVLKRVLMNKIGEYRHNPFMLDDRNLHKDLKLYDISRDVSTTELGRSYTIPPPMKAQSLLHPSAAPSSISLQPAFELDVGGGTKSLAGLGIIEREWEKSLRPVRQQQRVSSWSDMRSAWNDEGFWMSGKGKMRTRVNTTLNEMRKENGVSDDLDESKETTNKRREKGAESDQGSSKNAKMLCARRYVVLPLSV